MKKLLKRFAKFPFFVQLVWLLCVVGMCTSLVLLVRDMHEGGVLFRLHLGYFMMYAAQVGFILAREKYVALLTVLQGVLALLTTADFIFVPILQLLGRVYYWLCNPSVEALKVYQYVFVSMGFTLQMAVAAYLGVYFYKKPDKGITVTAEKKQP